MLMYYISMLLLSCTLLAITVGFTTSTTSVREHAPGVSLSVTRSSRIQNFNIAALSVMEDPNQGGCIG